jgi:rubredoxin
MSLELDHECPKCEAERAFYRTASTNLHLGEKTKWRCPECDFGFVRIDGDIDTGDLGITTL